MHIRGGFRDLRGSGVFLLVLALPAWLLACDVFHSGRIGGTDVDDGEQAGGEPGVGGRTSSAGGSAGTTPAGGNGAAGGNSAGSGAGGTGKAGSGGSASGGAGVANCPSEPPFDEKDQDLVARCTRPIAVAVGNALRRALSYDGEKWFGDVCAPGPGEDQNEESHRNVAIGGGIIVIVGDGGIFTSRDAGITFVKKDTGRSLHNSAVVYFQSAFWVLGNTMHTSKDGVTWQSWDDGATLPGGIRTLFGPSDAATDGKIALFVNGSSYRRFDGMTWTQGSLPDGKGDALTYASGRFLMFSYSSSVTFTSTNGTDWSPGPDGDLSFGDVIWDGTRFFGTGGIYDAHSQTSDNGLNWQRQTTNVAIGPVTRMNNVYIGASGGTLYRSSDGKSWGSRFRACGDEDWGFTAISTGPVLK